MSIRRPLALAATLLASLCPAAAADSLSWKWTPEVLADITRLQEVQIAPDGARVVYAATRRRPEGAPLGGAYVNLWMAPAEGGPPRRLTSADAKDESPAWSGDGKAIAFLSDRGGDKAKTRLFVMPADGGEAWPISSDKADVETFAWSRDGRRLAWIAIDPRSDVKEAAEKAGRDWKVIDQEMRPRRLWTADVPEGGSMPASPPAPRPVTALGERSAWQLAWAPDGQALVATVTETPRTDDAYLKKRILVLPVQAGARSRELVGIVGKVDQVLWANDGRTIVWRGGVDGSDPTSGSVFAVPAAGGRPVNLSGDREETVRDLLWSDGVTVVCVAVQGTRTALVAQDLKDPASRRLLVEPGRLEFDAGSADASGRRFAFAAATAAGPDEVYAAGAGLPPPARRVSDLNPQLAGLRRGRQETVRYKASDGLEIEGVLLRPTGDAKRESYPLVVIVHGGPEYEFHDGWVTRYSEPGQALAERGFFVFYPNYRGSAGRGVAFAKGNHHDLGGREFQDILDGIEWLAGRDRIDRRRVGMTGGSYGGYFTSLAVTRYSEHFAAGVSLFGISHWLSFLGQSDIPAENSAVHWDLWCYERGDVCRDASPVEQIARARTPTLIFQGEADLRVPKPQSDELYAALKWKGVPAEYVVFPREKHGFVEREHQVETARRLLEWFVKYLKP